MTIRVCIAGATGWTGKALAHGILATSDIQLVSAIARRQAGTDMGIVLGRAPLAIPIVASLEEALATPFDVLIDFTEPTTLKERVFIALDKGVRVVIGTSGLTASDYQEIERRVLARDLGVIAAGNFSITAALAKHFALIAARYLPAREIVEYASAQKHDVPSGTARELAEALATIAPNQIGIPLEQIHGPKDARGAAIEGTQVHSIRLPSFTISFETIFGLPDERLSIRHDAGTSAEPYVSGSLMAIRKVMQVQGLVRGLDQLLFQTE